MFVSLTKLEIAEAQLYQSISLYMEGKDLISAVTLAGASDEILGKMNQAVGRSAALHDKLDLLCNLSEAAFKKKATRKNFAEIRNKARNAFKHFGSGDLTNIDLEQEAYSLVSRAIENYKKLKPGFNRPFWDFEKERSRRHRSEQAEILKKAEDAQHLMMLNGSDQHDGPS